MCRGSIKRDTGCSRTLHDHLVDYYFDVSAGTRVDYIEVGSLAKSEWGYSDVISIVNDHASGSEINCCWCSLAREGKPIFEQL